jgi:hypothetical protein
MGGWLDKAEGVVFENWSMENLILMAYKHLVEWTLVLVLILTA